MERKIKSVFAFDAFFCAAVLFVLALGFFSIFLRMGTRFLVKRGLCNERIASVIFFDKPLMTSQEIIGSVNWKALYPVSEKTNDYYQNKNFSLKEKSIALQIPKIKNAAKSFETWMGENFFCRNFFIFFSKFIEKNLGASFKKNEIETFTAGGTTYYKLQNGHITEFRKKEDTSKKAESLLLFKNLLEKTKTPFLYVQAPFKIDPEDEKISGKLDFSNQNADEFLLQIKNMGIPFLDMRREIKKTGFCHYDFFYKTDHHWKAEAGLWAAFIIAQKLNDDFFLGLDADFLDAKNFDFEIFKNSFLGSGGRALTLSNAKMEDFTLITPKRDFLLDVEFFSASALIRKTTGGFSALLFPKNIQTKNTAYTASSYATYMAGDTNARIKNRSAQNTKRILFCGDSFTDVVEPFFALLTKEFDTLDLRHFDGSLTSWLEKNGPYDAVVMLLNASALDGNSPKRSDLWDFR